MNTVIAIGIHSPMKSMDSITAAPTAAPATKASSTTPNFFTAALDLAASACMDSSVACFTGGDGVAPVIAAAVGGGAVVAAVAVEAEVAEPF
jgi:hypothetical protein